MIGKSIKIAKNLLAQEEVVAFPTDSVYGLGVLASSEKAIEKVFAIKKRPHSNPLILHVKNIEAFYQYADSMSELSLKILEVFRHQPVTLLLKKRKDVSDLATSNTGKIAIRIPHHPLTISLLDSINDGLFAPSANLYQKLSSTTAMHVKRYFRGKVKYILDGGRCRLGLESTILETTEDNEIYIRREGSVLKEEIEKKLNTKVLSPQNVYNIPGSSSKHYSPNTPLIVEDILSFYQKHPSKKIAYVFFEDERILPKGISKYPMSKTKQLTEAAKNLYWVLHRIDKKNFDCIIIKFVVNDGIGKIINDRIRKAQTLIQ